MAYHYCRRKVLPAMLSVFRFGKRVWRFLWQAPYLKCYIHAHCLVCLIFWALWTKDMKHPSDSSCWHQYTPWAGFKLFANKTNILAEECKFSQHVRRAYRTAFLQFIVRKTTLIWCWKMEGFICCKIAEYLLERRVYKILWI